MAMAISEAVRLQAVELLAHEQAQELSELRARVAALEARPSAMPSTHAEHRQLPERLRGINASRQARCNRLREAIASILAQRPGAEAITAKNVAQALGRAGFTPMPKDRTVRTHLAAARASMAAHGRTGNGQKSA
jgi:hypothetical protein